MGNQLYQLAAASLLASQFGQPVRLFTQGLQGYIAVRTPDSLRLVEANGWLLKNDVESINFANWISVYARAGRLLPIYGVNDRNLWKVLSRRSMHVPLFVDGYFQSGWTQETFSKALASISIADISNNAGERIHSDEVAIHIRGGDFLKDASFHVVDSEFYICAIEQAMDQGWKSFAIISDDWDYANQICKSIVERIVNLSIRILPSGMSAIEDFDTIRAAPARIIGNSTFAWWAVALAKNSSPTWSANYWTVNRKRDFYLQCEIPLKLTEELKNSNIRQKRIIS